MWDASSAAGVQFPPCARSRMQAGQVGLFKPQPKRWLPPRLATRYWGGLHLVFISHHHCTCIELQSLARAIHVKSHENCLVNHVLNNGLFMKRAYCVRKRSRESHSQFKSQKFNQAVFFSDIRPYYWRHVLQRHMAQLEVQRLLIKITKRTQTSYG